MASNNKEKVVQAATELFHRKGFQATGLEEILTLSGVCKSNFYYHFKSKDELGLAVLEQQITDIQRTYVEPTLGNTRLAPKERLIGFFEGMIGFMEAYDCQRGCMLGNLTLELAGHHEGMRTRLEGFFKGLEDRVKAALSEGMAEGQLQHKGLSAEQAATAVVSLLQGGMLLTKGYRETAPLVSSMQLLMYILDSGTGMGTGHGVRAVAN